MTVKGMHDHRNFFMERGQASQRAGFSGMGMHNIGLEFTDDFPDLQVGLAIARLFYFPWDLRQLPVRKAHVFYNKIRAFFTVLLHPRDQQRLIIRSQVPGQ